MSGYTYTQFKSTIANLMVVEQTDVNFYNILPSIIDYAENRIQRDIDFLATVNREPITLSANNRLVTIPGTFQVVEQFNLITPIGVGSDSAAAVRTPLLPTTKEVLDAIYNSSAGSGIPQFFAPINDVTFVVGPWPSANYTLEVVGTKRLTPLSESNASNYISLVYPDLYIAAAMVFASGYQKNFGSQSEDPAMAQSWENQYKTLLQSAIIEDERRGFQSSGWVSKAPAPLATPLR
jgi:hypothetical protein